MSTATLPDVRPADDLDLLLDHEQERACEMPIHQRQDAPIPPAEWVCYAIPNCKHRLRRVRLICDGHHASYLSGGRPTCSFCRTPLTIRWMEPLR